MATRDTFVSVVVALHNDAVRIRAFLDDLMPLLRQNYENYELVLVDDGSTDNTVQVLQEALAIHPCVRVIRLAKEFGSEIAISAGLDSVIGDFVVVLDLHSDPPAMIPDAVTKAQSGPSIIVGVQDSRGHDPLWLRLGSALFHATGRGLYHWSIPRNTTSFRVLTRQCVSAVTKIKDKQRYLRLLTSMVGYGYQTYRYQPIRRPGGRKRGFVESVGMAMNILLTHSTHPMRWIGAVGLVASGLNLFYMLYVVSIYLFRPHVAEGWTTLSLQMSGMFFLLFLMLSLMGEYVGRILEESRDRPLYYVLEEMSSNVLVAHPNKRNVTHSGSGA